MTAFEIERLEARTLLAAIKIADLPSELELKPTGASAVAGGRLYLGNRDGGFYRTVGEADGTDFLQSKALGVNWKSPEIKLGAIGKLFLTARNEDGSSIDYWATDGTPAGTVLLKSRLYAVQTWNNGEFIVNAGRFVFFTDSVYLYRTDGTARGTVRLKNAWQPSNLVVAGDQLYFESGANIWTSDGTNVGTVPLPHISGFVSNLAAAGSELFFFHQPPSPQFGFVTTPPSELWKLDLSSLAPTNLSDAAPSPWSAEQQLAIMEARANILLGYLVFVARSQRRGERLIMTL